MKTKTFETFRDLQGSYWGNQIKCTEPSNINFLTYRKFKVTIELIEEPKEVLIERLETLLKNENSYSRKSRISTEIALIKNT